MSRVRRIPVGPSAPYKPFYTIVIRRRYQPTRLDFHLPTLAFWKNSARFMAALAVAVLICAAAWLAPSNVSLTSLPPSVFNPPIYPNAQQIEARPQQYAQYSCGREKEMAFMTTDAPNRVFAFYRDVLIKDGWQETIGGPRPFESGMSDAFFWSRNSLNGYRMDNYELVIYFPPDHQGEFWFSMVGNCQWPFE